MDTRSTGRVLLAMLPALAAGRAAVAQSFQFDSRIAENTVYCGAPSGGPLIDHRFQTADTTDDNISVSDPGGPTRSPSSAEAHLGTTFSGNTLFIDENGASARTGAAGGAYATADSRDSWNVNLFSSACFRLTVSLNYASSEGGLVTQGFNFGVSGSGLIHLSDGTNTMIITRSISTPGSWSGEFSGTLAPGQYFITLGGRCEGSNSPYNGSFQHAAALALVSCPCSPDFNNDGDVGTDADIEAFFACLAGSCCMACGSPDFNNDGDIGTDADIESFFRVLGGGAC